MRKFSAVALTGLVVLALGGCPRPEPPSYATTTVPLDDIPPLGSVLNNAIQVVGSVYSMYAEGDAYAAVWDGALTVLPHAFDPSPRSSLMGYGRAISGTGAVLAAEQYISQDSQSTPLRAWLWAYGSPTECALSFPFAVNNNLDVVGALDHFTPPQPTCVPLLSFSGFPLALLSGDAGGYATDINNFFRIVGSTFTADGVETAVMWGHFGRWELGGLGGSFSRAESVNEFGTTVGTSLREDNEHYGAWIWDRGTLNELPRLGGLDAAAHDINVLGNVVGRSTDRHGESRAVLWEKTASGFSYRALDLNGQILDTGVVLTEAFSINDRNYIVAKGTRDGEPAFFLLSQLRPVI